MYRRGGVKMYHELVVSLSLWAHGGKRGVIRTGVVGIGSA